MYYNCNIRVQALQYMYLRVYVYVHICQLLYQSRGVTVYIRAGTYVYTYSSIPILESRRWTIYTCVYICIYINVNCYIRVHAF